MPKMNEKLFILTSFALSITISASVWAATLVWDHPNAEQVDGYKVYYGTSNNNVNQSIDVGDATSFNLDQLPLIKNVQYWFTVSAYNAVVESGKATPLSYTPINTTPPPAPTDLSDEGFGNILGGDQSHVNEVNYFFEGRTGDILLEYEVWDIDVYGEVEILLNGAEVGLAPLTDNEAWSWRQMLLIPDSLVNDTADNYLTFNNTFNPPNVYWWGVRSVSVDEWNGDYPSLAPGDEIVIERVKDGTFFWSAMVKVTPFFTEITGRFHDIDFHPDAPQIDIFFNEAGVFGLANFNGFRFWDINNTIADFKDVSIWSSNIIGFDESRISFNSDNIYMNFEGLAFGAGNYVSLRIGD